MESNWIYCSNCGKKLIKKLSNGLYEFKFGRIFDGDLPNGANIIEPMIDIQIHGSIKIKCFRRSCKQINVITFFTDNNQQEVEENTQS